MLPILSSEQIHQLDQFTTDQEKISSFELMERACQAFADWYVQRHNQTKRIAIVCGTGNNGGDGLGIARLLKEHHYRVHVFVIDGKGKRSADFLTNLEKAKDTLQVTEITEFLPNNFLNGFDVLIDALFGSGLSRSLDGIYANAIEEMNQSKSTKIAVDIPSGLMADHVSTGAIFKADRTVSFQLPKLTFLLPHNNQYVGEWSLVDIGLTSSFYKQIDVPYFLTTKKSVKNLLQVRKRFSHKGNYGHALLIVGSYGKMGAAILSARAALRSGLGLLTVHVPASGNQLLQMSAPEATTSVDQTEKYFTALPADLNFTAIGIGPGIGQADETVVGFKKLLSGYKAPIVLDADALNILSQHPSLLKQIPANSILTPHPKEFERLVGAWKDDFNRLQKQIDFSKRINCVIILKGAFTSISLPNGKVYFNPTGNPGMATGGSGDVLTGILTGLLAQGYSAEHTAILGVYLHGFAGDLAAQELGMNSLIASDLIDSLPQAFIKLQKEN